MNKKNTNQNLIQLFLYNKELKKEFSLLNSLLGIKYPPKRIDPSRFYQPRSKLRSTRQFDSIMGISRRYYKAKRANKNIAFACCIPPIDINNVNLNIFLLFYFFYNI